MPERLTFYSDGIPLVGYLHRPVGEGPWPAVVLCHGFGAHQARHLPEIAAALAAAGFLVLTFDYRGFGESGGPRWRLIPLEQVADIRSAITFVLSLEDCGGWVALVGNSFGGANACYAGAIDERVAAVVSIVGVGPGELWLRTLHGDGWEAFWAEVAADWVDRVRTGTSRMVDKLHIMKPDPLTRRVVVQSIRDFPESSTHLPLETAQAVIDYRPEEVIGRLAGRPVLFIVGADDVLVPNEVTRALFDRAAEPKQWVVLPGVGHYDVYHGAAFDRTIALTAEALRQAAGRQGSGETRLG